MSVDEIQNLTLTVDRALKMVAQEVKSEMQIANAATWSYEKREKEILLEKLDEKINIGIEEASILMSLSQYISLLESEKVKFSLQIERLKQENEWLMEEQNVCERKLQDVRGNLDEVTNDRDMCRAAYVLRKNNPASCDRIVNEFSKIMTSPGEGHDETLSPEFENFFSSKVQALYYLSIQCIKHNEFGLARLLVNRMLERITITDGPTAPDVASLYEILAMISRREGKLEQSLCYLQKSLQIREACFGVDAVQVSITLNNMSICQSKMGLFKDARESCARALTIKENAHGSSSSDVAKQLHNLALVCTYLGRFTEAHKYFQRAINIHKDAKPFDEEKMLKTQNSVAMCYLRQNNIADAQSIIFSLIDRYHERILHRKPSLPNDPSIHMIVEMYAKEKRKAVNVLNLTYGSFCINELSLVVKNLCTMYRKQKQDIKMEIIQDWLQKKQKARYNKSTKVTHSKSDIPRPKDTSKISQESNESRGTTGSQKSDSVPSDYRHSLLLYSSADEGSKTDDGGSGSKRESRKLKNPFAYIFRKKS